MSSIEPPGDEQPGINWFTTDALRMADHVEKDHEDDPDKVSRECSTCLAIVHEAERHIEERDERYLRVFGHRREERA